MPEIIPRYRYSVFKVQLVHHIKKDLWTDGKGNKSKVREKHRKEYVLRGKNVCRETARNNRKQ